MSRKHYIAAAAIVKAQGEDRGVVSAEAFATLFASENPRFDRVRLYEACGLADEAPTLRRVA